MLTKKEIKTEKHQYTLEMEPLSKFYSSFFVKL